MFLLILLLVIILLTLVITFVHELGHFIIAKINGVRVLEFAIGFGPKLFSWNYNNTTYSFKLLPLGGYVSVLSNELVNQINKIRDNSLITNEQKLIILNKIGIKDLNYNFSNDKTIEQVKNSKNALFALGGVIFNFISVIFTLFFLNISYGREFKQDSFYYIVNKNYTNGSINVNRESNIIIEDLNYYDESGTELLNISGYSKMKNFLNNKFSSSKVYKLSDFDIINTDVLKNFYYLDGSNPISISSDFETISPNIFFNYTYSNLFINKNIFVDSDLESFIPINPIAFFIGGLKYDDGLGKTSDIFYSPNSSFSKYKNLSSEKYNLFVYFDSLYENIEYITSSDYFVEYSSYKKLNYFDSIYYSIIDSFRLLFDSILWMLNVFTFGAIYNMLDVHQSMEIIDYDSFWYWVKNFIDLFIWFSLLVLIFNIIPIPPLDGWKFFEYSYSGIIKKELSNELVNKVSKIGWFILFFYFMFYILF